MRKLLTCALLLGAFSLMSCSQKAPLAGGARSEITFAVLSVEQSQNLQKNWAPIFADMEKQTGLKVHPFYSSSYTALIEAMRFNQVQAAWFSNASGLEAMKRANGEVFAHTTYPNGQEGYHSIIIAPKASRLNTADDLLKCNKTLNFGMGDVKSTSGYVAPMAYLFLPRHVD
ncbi:MAG: phosphate/phosphite/phosphonate ABC transporter substrate-binding protein, partial [Asticcacaulis sp.]